MQLFLMIAAALLISAYSAPTTESPMDSEEETVTTKFNNTSFLFPLENIPKIELPKEDKKILCDFLGTFSVRKLQLHQAIFAINMLFLHDVRKNAKNDVRGNQEKRPHNGKKTLLQKFIGVPLSPFTIYPEDKQKFQQDIGKQFEKTNEYFIKESEKIKSNLSRETVESEEEFFERIKAFEGPAKNNYADSSNLINTIQKQFTHRYQCPDEDEE